MPEVKDKTTGQVIAKMPYDTAGKMAAEKMVAENPGYEIKDGAQRNEQMYAGGGKTGYNAIGNEMYKKGGEVEDRLILKDAIAREEKEKGPDWHNKLTADDLGVDVKRTSSSPFITRESRKELRKEKRLSRKAIRKSKRQTIKEIRKKSKEDTAKRLEGTKHDTLDGSKWKHRRHLKKEMKERRRDAIKAERARKRKAIKAMNRIGALTGE